MKYGMAFILLAVLIAGFAIRAGGWFYFLLWPALSFAVVSVAYFRAAASIFGKRPTGTLPFGRSFLLAPFLAYLTSVWHVVRYFSREPVYNQLTENVFIGRRLLSHEKPSNFDQVVDLTCEFNEPQMMRGTGYLSFPILDASCPDRDDFLRCVAQVAELRGTVYIHCAQGHGRTAMFAIAYLIHRKIAATINDAVDYVLKCRPDAHLGRSQYMFLESIYGVSDQSAHRSENVSQC